jgi:hypothetical protein
MQPFNKGESFTASITAFDSSNNVIGTITQPDATGAAFGEYNITAVGVRSSTTPIKSIVIKVVEARLGAFATGQIYFTPGRSNSSSPLKEKVISLPGMQHCSLLTTTNPIQYTSLALLLVLKLIRAFKPNRVGVGLCTASAGSHASSLYAAAMQNLCATPPLVTLTTARPTQAAYA